jgi:hypothetical protein
VLKTTLLLTGRFCPAKFKALRMASSGISVFHQGCNELISTRLATVHDAYPLVANQVLMSSLHP